MIEFRGIGDWPRGRVGVSWAASGRRVVDAVEQIIEREWQRASERLGEKLFDGPMCRLESWSVSAERLELVLSRTSYKPFLGTNLHNPQLADRFGLEVLANPVGVSSVLVSRDGWLMLGRRTPSVAYYPERVHPFAGALEPGDDLDVFDEAMRELGEELSFTPRDVEEMRCVGLIEDRALRQPELIFMVRSSRRRGEIERTLDGCEHDGSIAVAATGEGVEKWLQDEALTPVAMGSLALWGRWGIGDGWFERTRASLG